MLHENTSLKSDFEGCVHLCTIVPLGRTKHDMSFYSKNTAIMMIFDRLLYIFRSTI